MASPGARVSESRNVAVVCADAGIVAGVQSLLEGDFQVLHVDSPSGVEVLTARMPVAGIVLDAELRDQPLDSALVSLEVLRRRYPHFAILALTRTQTPETRVRLTQAGADEVLGAPLEMSELKPALTAALERRSAQAEAWRAADPLGGGYSFCELIGASEAMRNVYSAILRVAQSDTSVVIRGESGTGKELVARSIVSLGPRRDKPFISLNCAALPEHLIEAELFGHEKGAFTGAVTSRAGQIELADGGTLFLDEIATLSLGLQSKLLRVLEDRAVQRLGGNSSRKIDFRLLTATHENLEQMVKEGRFRSDLYYRIHVVPILIPPLREREGDIALLTDHFLRLYCAANHVPLKRLDLEALEVLEENTWPGNVRELQNLIQRLVLMVEGKTIAVHHLPQQILYSSTTKHEALLIPAEGIDFDKEMEKIEAAYLRAALRRAGGKKTVAAALLRLNQQRMKYLCRKYRADLDGEG